MGVIFIQFWCRYDAIKSLLSILIPIVRENWLIRVQTWADVVHNNLISMSVTTEVSGWYYRYGQFPGVKGSYRLGRAQGISWYYFLPSRYLRFQAGLWTQAPAIISFQIENCKFIKKKTINLSIRFVNIRVFPPIEVIKIHKRWSIR